MGEEVLVPAVVFGTGLGIVWLVQYFASVRAKEVQETIRRAMESGQQLTPDVIRALGAPRRQKGGDLRWGVVWLAVGLGFASFGLAMGYFAPEAMYPIVGVAAVPAFIGLALIAVHYLISGKSD